MPLAKRVLSALRDRLWQIEDRMSVRLQIALAVALLGLAMVGAVSVGAALVGRSEATVSESETMAGMAALLADRIDRGMVSRLNTLSLLAEIEPLKTVWTRDPAALRRLLDRTQAAIPGAAWLGFATPDGIVRAATRGMLEGQSVASRPWFRDGLHGPVFEDIHEAALLAPLLRPDNNARSEPLRFLDVAVPVIDEKGVKLGVLGLHISWTWVRDLTRSAVIDKDGVVAELWIIAKDGTMILGPALGSRPYDARRLAEIGRDRRGAFADDTTGGGMLAGYSIDTGYGDFHGFGWTFVAREPTEVAFRPARDLIWTIIALGLIVALIGVGASILIAERAARPIRTITEAANRLDHESVEQLPRVRGSREVVRLSSALRALMLRLGFAERRRELAEVRAADEAAKFNSDLAALRNLADTDALTRLANRRGFQVVAEEALDQYRRYGRLFAMLMIDIDHFKNVNDHFGHAAGDAVIRSVANLICGVIRPSDRAARFGGEEFVVMLREVGFDEALDTAERIRAAAATSRTDHESVEIATTVSIGVAIIDGATNDVQDVIQRADLALYSAKAGGRNRVSGRPMSPASIRLSA